ncbi:MAG: prepilin-type N-terminal cleavage/methylation domain-containing protein [Verrucomicrobia bacterium]|nr:prepilin-type N-terminal cleavage/methylation domain-containing protein [Verrucomicrobiota bacterium]
MLAQRRGPGEDGGNPSGSGLGGWWHGRRGGFSLLEVLVVMTIMSLLMAASSALFHSSFSKSSEPAARLARGIELARAQAVAGNHSVAIRFEFLDEREMVMRFLRCNSGCGGQATVTELRRPERFLDITIAPGLARSRGAADPRSTHELAVNEALVITSDGQVLLGTGTRGFPEAAEQLVPVINLGVQPTHAGRVAPGVPHDVAIVQVQCATGTARVLPP